MLRGTMSATSLQTHRTRCPSTSSAQTSHVELRWLNLQSTRRQSRQSSRLRAASSDDINNTSGEPIRLLPVALSALSAAAPVASVYLQGTTEAACLNSLWTTQLITAIMFLFYCTSSLQTPAGTWLGGLTSACKQTRASWLYGAAFSYFTAYAGSMAWLTISYAGNIQSELVPLQAVALVCLAVLAGSERGKQLKSKVRMELEAGEGQRHSVMAQGGRLAMRNYLWAFFAGAGILAAAQGLAGSMDVVLAGAYGLTALAYVAAGWLKFSE